MGNEMTKGLKEAAQQLLDAVTKGNYDEFIKALEKLQIEVNKINSGLDRLLGDIRNKGGETWH